MSVSMSKVEGVTMLALNSDPQSVCPPLCQILMGLCYSPVCCSVSQHLRRIRSGSMSVLGTLQIIVGLLTIGLSVILTCSRSGSSWQMDSSGYPYWMGAFFIVFGSVCILTEKYPSPCLVIVNMLLHFAAVGFAIAAIVLFSINVGSIWMGWMCSEDYYYYRYRSTTLSPTRSEEKQLLQNKCLDGQYMLLMLLRSINAVLIVLSVLELSVVISAFFLSIKMLRRRAQKISQHAEEPDTYQPLLENDAKLLAA